MNKTIYLSTAGEKVWEKARRLADKDGGISDVIIVLLQKYIDQYPFCPCGRPLTDVNWKFCPDCGRAV